MLKGYVKMKGKQRQCRAASQTNETDNNWQRLISEKNINQQVMFKKA